MCWRLDELKRPCQHWWRFRRSKRQEICNIVIFLISVPPDATISKAYLFKPSQILSHRLASLILCNIMAEPEQLCPQPLRLRI